MRYGAGLLVAATALAACTQDPGFTGVAGVREATPAEVAACRQITDIRGTPSVFGPLATQGLKYMRNKIMADAQAAGANTVVFDQATPGADIYELHAVAYAC
jgi:hypothetical protein